MNEKKHFCFSSVLAFKQAKEQIFFQGQPLKMFFFNNLAALGLPAIYSEALRPKSRQL